MDKVYMCIDLKSFYASVECVERGLDPLTTNLVVADKTRTEKTICLAVSPSLKQYGISGRSRLYEVIEKVKEINILRRKNIKTSFSGNSYNDIALKNDPNLKVDFIVAPPRMKYYMKYSNDIYNIYLKYISPDDILVYSIDEVFCDITNYLKLYKLSSEELTTKIINDVYNTTGITATAGIGTNMYLAKIAMDIVAKHSEPNENGARMAFLDEMLYRKELWNHEPITDFWRVGRGISSRLEKYNIKTMGDIARISINDENLLYKILGINAEILIDHAWGYEPCTIKDAKNYKPKASSLSSGQVLHVPYNYRKARLILKEMTELLTLDLVDKNLVTDKLVITIGYDIENLKNKNIRDNYFGEIVKDFYGRSIPKHSHGTINIDHKTSSTKVITSKVLKLYDNIINPDLLIRRINIVACNLSSNNEKEKVFNQFDLFNNQDEFDINKKKEQIEEMEEHNLQKVIIELKNKYGKNAILRGMNLEEGATTISRNKQVGGHNG
ncbi:MAG: DNA methylase [Bacilli bacterium]|nr:DNA methylase [Bacilli bacterium]